MAPSASPDRSKESAPLLHLSRPEQERQKKGSKSVSFAFDIKVLVSDYVADGLLFMKRHYEGGFIYRELILVEAIPDDTVPAGWSINYGYQDINPGKPGVKAGDAPPR